MLLLRLKHLFRNLLKYPWLRLVPQGYYKYIDIEALNSIHKYMVRRSLVKKHDTFDKFGFVRQEALFIEKKEQDFFQLSVNLLGLFRQYDIKYRIQGLDNSKKHKIDWTSGDYFALSKFQHSCFDITVPIYMKIEDIHNRVIPFEKTISNKKTECIECILKLTHKPTYGNYWHFEFCVLEGKEPISASNTEWKKKGVKKIIELHMSTVFSESPI